MGILEHPSEMSEYEEKTYYVGDSRLSIRRDNMYIQNVLDQNSYSKFFLYLFSLVNDFDLFDKVADYGLFQELMIDSKDHPIIFTEPSIHNKEKRLKLTEFMFEKYGIPAFFICKSAVLSGFSCGRYTCLVLDSATTNTYATPVHDGYALQTCII